MADAHTTLLFRNCSRRLRRTELRAFLHELAAKLSPGRTVTCLISSDADLRGMNRKFRRKDYATDVLSFPANGGDSLGELAISIDRAAAQAAEFGHSTEDEIRILMLHGILHLIGMDHETDSGRMARAEAAWRKRLGLPTGLIERVTA